MASNDQFFKAGEAKGQAQEKTETLMDNLKKNTQWATDKVCETAQAAKNTAFGVAEDGKKTTCETAQVTKDKAVESKDQTSNFFTDKAVFVKDKAFEAADATKKVAGDAVTCTQETAQTGTEKAGSFLQGATDAVKNTFGFGGDNKTTTPTK